MAWVTLVTTFHSQVSVQLYDKATQQAATKNWSRLILVQKNGGNKQLNICCRSKMSFDTFNTKQKIS